MVTRILDISPVRFFLSVLDLCFGSDCSPSALLPSSSPSRARAQSFQQYFHCVQVHIGHARHTRPVPGLKHTHPRSHSANNTLSSGPRNRKPSKSLLDSFRGGRRGGGRGKGRLHCLHSHPYTTPTYIKPNCKAPDLNERPVTKPPQTRQGEAPTKSQQAYPGSDFVQLWTTAVAAAAAAGAALLLLLLHSPLRHVSRRSCRVYYCCCCVLWTDHHRR